MTYKFLPYLATLLAFVFSGYENFVSKLGIGDHEDRPAWMGKVSFSDLKMKLIGGARGAHRYKRLPMAGPPRGWGNTVLKAFFACQTYTTVIRASHPRLTVAAIRLRGTARATAANKKML